MMKSLKKFLYSAFCLLAMNVSNVQADTIDWINHFDLLSGNPRELFISTNSGSSGVGGGLTGVVVKASAAGDTFSDGTNKVVHMALNLPPQPPGIAIRGVRICYESTSTASYITQTRIAQVQNPPSSAVVLMDNLSNLTAAGANCTTLAGNAAIGNGPLLLSLRFYFANTTDAVVIRGLGIVLG